MVLLKIFCSSLVLLSSSIMGFLYGGKYRKRLRSLNLMEQSIRLLMSEIIQNSTPLPEALYRVSKMGDKEFGIIFDTINKNLMENREGDVYISFLSVKEILRDSLFLNDDDIEVFLSLGKVIGKTNKMDQEKSFNFVLDQINYQVELARDEKIKYEKMYPSLGIIIGIGIVIIFI